MLRKSVWLGSLLAAVLIAGAGAARGASGTVAAPLRFANPLRQAGGGKPLSCPDPTVSGAAAGRYRYVLVCTSDNARNAFPIYLSVDLVHWVADGWVFPHGHEPSWAVPSDGRTRAGIYWAPSITRNDGRWIVYFSAIYDDASHAIGANAPRPGTMVLGAATSSTLAGPWQGHLIHYPGQLNAKNPPVEQEHTGGDIDPGVVLDPLTHTWTIFWAEQREQVWESELSSDGLTVGPETRLAFGVTQPWECDPLDRECTVEGPQPFWHDGQIEVLYSGASTWDGTYAVGAAASGATLDPAAPFVKDAQPILRSGNGFMGPGGTSAPVKGPDGRTYILYHALTRIPTSHDSAARVLMLGTVNWAGGYPLIDDGVARRNAGPAGSPPGGSGPVPGGRTRRRL